MACRDWLSPSFTFLKFEIFPPGGVRSHSFFLKRKMGDTPHPPFVSKRRELRRLGVTSCLECVRRHGSNTTGHHPFDNLSESTPFECDYSPASLSHLSADVAVGARGSQPKEACQARAKDLLRCAYLQGVHVPIWYEVSQSHGCHLLPVVREEPSWTPQPLKTRTAQWTRPVGAFQPHPKFEKVNDQHTNKK